MTSGFLSTQPTQCTESFATPSSFPLVMEHDPNRWASLGLNKRIPGATFRCTQDQSVLVQQWVSIYPAFVDATQFKTVVIHELGHALGLDHSCINQGGLPDFKACAEIPGSHDYAKAVMYPSLSANRLPSGKFETKESLRNNDLVRSACLYEGK